jgi:hypothetical protein
MEAEEAFQSGTSDEKRRQDPHGRVGGAGRRPMFLFFNHHLSQYTNSQTVCGSWAYRVNRGNTKIIRGKTGVKQG